jgi:hypothetical protein
VRLPTPEAQASLARRAVYMHTYANSVECGSRVMSTVVCGRVCLLLGAGLQRLRWVAVAVCAMRER